MSQEEIDGTVVTVGTILTNPLKAWDVTKIVFVFWQMIGTNILLYVGHHSEFSSYAAYTLRRIIFETHVEVQEPKESLLALWMTPNGSILPSEFGHGAKDNLCPPFKTNNYNSIYRKLNLREKKKKKTGCASTSREEPAQAEDDFDWLKNLEVSDDEEEALAPPQEKTQPPLPPSRRIWNTLDNLSTRVDNMSLGMREMRRVQKEMRQDQIVLMRKHKVVFQEMSTHLGFTLNGYSFHYPLPFLFTPWDPSEEDDGET